MKGGAAVVHKMTVAADLGRKLNLRAVRRSVIPSLFSLTQGRRFSIAPRASHVATRTEPAHP